MRDRRLRRRAPRAADPHRRAAPARVPRLRLGGRRHPRRRPGRGAPQRRQDRRARGRDRPGRGPRHHRHRPHALGDPRPPERGERAPAPLRPLRRRAQRHHREPPRAQEAPPGARPRLLVRDRHRGRRRAARTATTAGTPAARSRRRSPRSRAPTRWRSSASRSPAASSPRARAARWSIGLGEGEQFLASDVPALIAHTREVVYLENGETAVLRREGVELRDAAGKARRPKVCHVPWDPVAAERGGYKHFMLKEIHEQPHARASTPSAPASARRRGASSSTRRPG